MSKLLGRAGCALLDFSLEVLDFTFRLGSNLVIVGGLSLVILVSYMVAGAL